MSESKLEDNRQAAGHDTKPAVAARPATPVAATSPVHVVYGGADRFSAVTPQKFGSIALATVKTYAPNFVEFAHAMHLPGWETLPHFPEAVEKLEHEIVHNSSKVKAEDHHAWFAWTVHRKTVEKLEREPVEDFRIDFEDGYGFRSDQEEDRDAVRAAVELAKEVHDWTVPPFCGIRIKSLSKETKVRGLRTLDQFLSTLIDKAQGKIPSNFVVTLPKVTDRKQVSQLCDRLEKFERKHILANGSIGIELMIESPLALFDRKGRPNLRRLVKAADGRCTSAHFGAFDHTSALGITALNQSLDHPACDFARQMMVAALAPLGIRLSDSVTTELPLAIHKKGRLGKQALAENRRSIHHGWQVHFQNVTNSMRNGFYQSWDLHPNQLPSRYAAVYAFFLENCDTMAERLKRILEKQTQAVVTANTFDDAATAEGVMNFFRRGSDCGAFDEKEIRSLLGVSTAEFRGKSFTQFASMDQRP